MTPSGLKLRWMFQDMFMRFLSTMNCLSCQPLSDTTPKQIKIQYTLTAHDLTRYPSISPLKELKKLFLTFNTGLFYHQFLINTMPPKP